MRTQSLIRKVSHERRVHDLEHLAATQRELFNAQLDEVSFALRPWEITRNVLAHAAPALPFIITLFGPGRLGLKLAGLLSAFGGLGRNNLASEEKGRFPWKSTLLLGTNMLARWLKSRRSK